MMSEETSTDSYDEHTLKQYGLVIQPDLARHFTDFEDIIDSLRLSWEGKDIDYTTQPPSLKDFGEPLLNQTGIGKLTSLMKSVCHKGIPMANFEQLRPYIFARMIGYVIAEDIFVNFNKYGIQSVEDANRLIFPSVFTFFATATRPVAEGERKFIKGYTRESHVIGPQKKKGFGL